MCRLISLRDRVAMYEPTPPLLTLPAELQIVVAELMDDGSLLALGLLNRELAANTFDVFTKRFFTHRRHVATRHSPQVLRDITATPHFLRRIKRIELIAIGTDLQYDEYDSMPDAYPLETNDSPRWCRGVDDAYGWEETGVLDDIFRNLSSASTKQSLVLRSGSTHLDRALRSVAEGCPSPFTDNKHWFGVIAYMNSVRPWADTASIQAKSPIHFAETTIRTLLRSCYRPPSLALTVGRTSARRRSTNTDNEWLKRLSLSETEMLKDTFRRVTDFMIDLDHAKAPSPMVKELLSKLDRLQQLEVHQATTTALHVIGEILPSSRIETVNLRCATGLP